MYIKRNYLFLDWSCTFHSSIVLHMIIWEEYLSVCLVIKSLIVPRRPCVVDRMQKSKYLQTEIKQRYRRKENSQTCWWTVIVRVLVVLSTLSWVRDSWLLQRWTCDRRVTGSVPRRSSGKISSPGQSQLLCWLLIWYLVSVPPSC